MATIDFSQVKELKAIPDGTYDAVFTEFKEFKTKSKGEDAVAMTFSIQDDAYPEHEGRKMFRNYTLTAQALWALKQTVGYLGADPEEAFNGPKAVEDILNPLIGGKVRIEIGTRLYEGEERNEVRKVKPIDTGESW